MLHKIFPVDWTPSNLYVHVCMCVTDQHVTTHPSWTVSGTHATTDPSPAAGCQPFPLSQGEVNIMSQSWFNLISLLYSEIALLCIVFFRGRRNVYISLWSSACSSTLPSLPWWCNFSLMICVSVSHTGDKWPLLLDAKALFPVASSLLRRYFSPSTLALRKAFLASKHHPRLLALRF